MAVVETPGTDPARETDAARATDPALETGPADQADRALSAGRWHDAYDLLEDVRQQRELTATELGLLARAAYAAGHLEAAIGAWESLHGDRLAAGDRVAAADAATSVALYLMMDTGLMAPVRGWLTRAERLLEGEDEGPTHAWVAVVRTYERFMCGDMSSARRWAERAISTGSAYGAAAPVAIGQVALARVMIIDGEVDDGLELLDEAAVAIMSSDLDALTVGIVYCELICGMQGLAQFDRAEEWTEAMERWRRGHAFGGINGRCRVHRAEILRLRGSCAEAEEQALLACEELRPWMRREYGWPLTELGTIRLRTGDLEGAETAFLRAHADGWDPQPGLALLRLATGDVTEAEALIGDALDRPRDVPSKERPPRTDLRRAPLLDAQVEISLAAGDVATAERACAELSEIAAGYRSRALVAGAALARGRVALATGDPAQAVESCLQAVAGWSEVAAPYEIAVARTVLADAYLAAGHDGPAELERRAADTAFERMGSVPGRQAAPSSRRSDAAGDAGHADVFRCDGDTRVVTFGGTTVLIKDLKGMRYLARLLAEPEREFHVVDLVATEQGATATGVAPAQAAADGLAPSSGDAGPMLDRQAKEAYRRRLTEIDEDIDEATRFADDDRRALAEADRDYLVRELARAVGLGGRDRRDGSTSERARASVTRAVRYALARIAEHHPELAEHLRHTITTGTYCSYVPDPRLPTRWDTDGAPASPA